MNRAARWVWLLLLCAFGAHAEQFVDQGDYRVHYAAINTTELTPQVARQFGIDRTRNQILLVLNAQQRIDGRHVPVPATARGTATTLLGHQQTLALRPIHEAEVHYVVATFTTLDGEYMTIEADVLPQGSNETIPVRFKQQFYRD
jgi:hypothetical protein